MPARDCSLQSLNTKTPWFRTPSAVYFKVNKREIPESRHAGCNGAVHRLTPDVKTISRTESLLAGHLDGVGDRISAPHISNQILDPVALLSGALLSSPFFATKLLELSPCTCDRKEANVLCHLSVQGCSADCSGRRRVWLGLKALQPRKRAGRLTPRCGR